MSRMNYIMSLLFVSGACMAMDTAQSKTNSKKQENPFLRLGDKAEQRYQESDGFTNHGRDLEAPNRMQEFQKQKDREAKEIEIREKYEREFALAVSRSKAQLAEHKQFSDKWLDILFGQCKGVESSENDISCDQIMKDNARWVAIKPHMKDLEFGKRIMKHALDNLSAKDDARKYAACNLAAAICAGGDPNSRMSGTNDPHTALHVVTAIKIEHFALFNLLLDKGADPNLRCMPMHPLEFNSALRFKAELLKHGADKNKGHK